MKRKILIDAAFANETRVVLLNNGIIEDIEYESSSKTHTKSNIYLAKITKIEPSLQAAFIDYGKDRSGFLPFCEIHQDYYHIPVSDKQLLENTLAEITAPQITPEDTAEHSTKLSDLQTINDTPARLGNIDQLSENKAMFTLDMEFGETDVELEVVPTEKQEVSQKQYKIQEVIKKGQILLVQLVKESKGNKGALFTTYLSLAGKYCVLMPNKAAQNGISRRISSNDERKRLKQIIYQLVSEHDRKASSVIIRTAGLGRTTLDIKRDYTYLVTLWNNIRCTTLQAIAPCFIHQEEGIIQKTIRDMFDHTVQELLIQGNKAYLDAKKFVQNILPGEGHKIREYKNKTPIFSKFAIEEQLSTLYQPIVSLKSGGYIVINPTEALIAIDVNSGRSTSERNIEETALRTNLEAAKEIALQIRLRNLSGLLVIDFIDMHEFKNRKMVEQSFKEFLSYDRARIQTTAISPFGLLEMSRQRMAPSFLEFNSIICSYCNGKGLVRAAESNAILILRTIENEICNDNKVSELNIYAHTNAITHLFNHKRYDISLIEEKYKIKLNFYCDAMTTSDSYSIEKIKTVSNKSGENINSSKSTSSSNTDIDQEQEASYSNRAPIKQKYNKVTSKKETMNTGLLVNNNVGAPNADVSQQPTANIDDLKTSAEPVINNVDTGVEAQILPRRRTVKKRSIRKRGN